MIGVVYIHAGPEALRRFRIGKELKKKMASKRHGMITRSAITYDMLVTLRGGKREHRSVVLAKRDDDKALHVIIRYKDVIRAEIRGIYKDIYAMSPPRFYDSAEIIQRMSVVMD